MVAGLWGLEILLVGLHIFNPFGTYGDTTYLIGVWLAPALAWYGTSLAPAGRRLVPGLIAAGLTSSALGDLIWLIHYWTGPEPDVSIADIPFLVSYLGLGAAVLIVTTVRRGRTTYVDPDAVIDALTVVVVSLLLFWTFSVQDIVADESVSGFTRAVWASYPILDAVLLALVLRAISVRSTRDAIGIPFAAGVGCWLVSDIGYLTMTVDGAVSAVLDIGWMLGGMLIATSTLRPQGPPRAEDVEGALQHPMRKLGIAIGPLLVPPVLLLANAVLSEDPKAVAVMVGMFALVGLTFARMTRMLRSEARARAELAAARDAALEGSRARGRSLPSSPR